ncbi:MAG TPA: dolichyl-phosphate beta-glucosyltransferase [Candidatus Brocadiia bacterium]|nr:glycosyltransferase family 2 protein [Candidatus Brocadiales bacterium]
MGDGFGKEIHLSVVVPAYNEEKRIERTLREIIAYLKSKPFKSEIVVVNDGSNDGTSDASRVILDGFEDFQIISRAENRGKGYSVREGVLHAGGDIILFSDADLSTPMQEFDKLHEWIGKGYDIAIGSRAVKGAEVVVRQNMLRECMGKVFNLFVKMFTMRGISDTQCGFKCFTRKVAQDIFERQTIPGFGFDIEILFIARRLGFKIKEVPVRWFNSPKTKVNILSDPLKMFLDLFKIRLNHILGRYKI